MDGNQRPLLNAMASERKVTALLLTVLIAVASALLLGEYETKADILSTDLISESQKLIDTGVTDDLAPKIVCIVFNALTGMGEPIPVLDGGDCPNSPPAPPVPAPACSDALDNDGDGLVDRADPGCSHPNDTDETNETPGEARLVVIKIVINDNGATSTVSDFSLSIATSSSGFAETVAVSSGATTTVAAGAWTVQEIQKPGYSATFGGDCSASGQVTLVAGETKTCVLTNDDVPAARPFACADGIDNDADALIDGADPGCSGASDNDETDPPSGGSSTPSSTPNSGGGAPQNTGGGSPASPLSIGSPSLTGGGIVLGSTTTTNLPPEAIQSCDQYLTAFIRTGQKNDVDQVKRMQRFLRDFEEANLAETGVYDAVTLAAVHAFQTKYSIDILSPWGARDSTGYVYLTTRKKVNEIFCRFTKTFLLTADELKKIVETRALAERAAHTPTPPTTPSAPKVEKRIEKTVTAPSTSERTDRNPLLRALDFLRGAFDRS